MGRLAGTKTTRLHPYRVALAGGWGVHNFVNFLAAGYVVVVQIQPTVTFHDRCGICSSTRQILMQKYPRGIRDDVDKYQLATELYYWENARKVPIGGSQDAWGSVYPGINLLHYDFRHHNGVLPMARKIGTQRDHNTVVGKAVVLGKENLVLANTNQCVVVASDQLVVVVTENAVFVGDRNTDMKTLLEFVTEQAPEIV